MRKLLRRLRREAVDLLECVLLPGLAAILPWRLCYALFRWMARWHFLYAEASNRALAQATRRGWTRENARAWLARRKLTTLVDHADQYLALTRSDAWLKKHVRAQGQWPSDAGAEIFCTFHWGAGMWALRHAAAAGLQAHMMVAQPTRAVFGGHRILHRYIVARIASIARILQRPTLDASSRLKPALKALRAGTPLIAVVDVPSDQVSTSQAIPFLGMTARMPRALFRLAVEQKIPVTVFLSGIDMSCGDRFIRIQRLGLYDDADALVEAVFRQLEAAIAEDPAAWHFWGEADRFFPPADNPPRS